MLPWSHFYQTRSAWSVDQGSTDNQSPVNNSLLQLPNYDTKFSNSRDKIVDSTAFPSWSLIHGSSWSGLIKVEPGAYSVPVHCNNHEDIDGLPQDRLTPFLDNFNIWLRILLWEVLYWWSHIFVITTHYWGRYEHKRTWIQNSLTTCTKFYSRSRYSTGNGGQLSCTDIFNYVWRIIFP